MDETLPDLVCYECGGPLTIVERGTAYMTVVCADCGNSHGVEVTMSPDGTPVYWPAFRISPKGDVSK